jgi:hypothetical protein
MEPIDDTRESGIFGTPQGVSTEDTGMSGTLRQLIRMELRNILQEELRGQVIAPEPAQPATVMRDLPPVTPLPRRSSSLFFPAALNRTPAAAAASVPNTPINASGNSNERSVNVLVTAERLSEPQKMQTYSLHAILTFKKTWEVMCANSKQPIQFQEVISTKVLEEIWLKEVELNTEFSRTNKSNLLGLFDIEHVFFLEILARGLRPDSYQKYCDVMSSCTPRISVEPTRKLSDTGYETTLFPDIQNILEVAQDVDHFVRYKATSEDLNLLPRLEWGSDKDNRGLGAFAIVIAQLGRFAREFGNQMDRDQIKACKNMEEFIALASAKNHELSRASKKEYLRKQRLLPKPSLDVLSSKAEAKGQKAQNTRTSERELSPRPRDTRRNLFAVQDESDPAVEDDNDSTESRAKVHPDANEIDVNPDEMYFIKSASDPQYKAKPPERVQPCYQFFRGNCTAGSSCAYSHDRDVLIAYGEQRLSELVNSPYVTPQAMAEALKRKGTGSVTSQDVRRLPTGRGAGNVRFATRPAAAFITDDAADTEES